MIPGFFKKSVKKPAGASLFVKILTGTFLLVLITTVGMVSITRNVLHEIIDGQIIEKWANIGANAAYRLSDSIITDNTFGVHQILEELKINRPELAYLFIVDTNNEVVDSVFDYEVSSELVTANLPADGNENFRLFDTEDGRIHDIAVPINNGGLGFLRIGLSERKVPGIIDGKISGFIFILLVFAAASVLIVFAGLHMLYKPVSALASAVEQAGKSNFKVRLKPRGDDEIGRLMEAFNGMAENLEKMRDEITEKEQERLVLLKEIITGQDKERAKISMELHDQAGQLLSSLKIGLKSIEADVKTKKGREKIENYRELLNISLEKLHDLAVELRPPVLSEFGLFRGVKNFIGKFRADQNIKVEYSINFDEKLRLPEPVETGLYRIIQESFTNIARHSKATEAGIEFEKTGQELELIIQDNGIGMDAARKAAEPGRVYLGILGIRERVNILGGSFNMESSSGKGTKITIGIKWEK